MAETNWHYGIISNKKALEITPKSNIRIKTSDIVLLEKCKYSLNECIKEVNGYTRKKKK